MLTTKPAESGTSTAVFPEPRAELAQPRARGLGGGVGEGQLDQLHPVHRVEHVQGAEAVGPAARRRELRHRQRRGGGGEDGVVGEDPGEALVELALGLGILGNGLDDDRAGTQLRQVRDHPRGLLDTRASTIGRRLAAGPEDHVVGLRGGSGEPARDCSTACYSELLSHWLTGQSMEYPSRMRNANGREVVIVEAVRTPIGRGHPEKGYYKDTHPNELLGKTYTEVIDRAGIEASDVEDVITGCVQQYGEQMFNVGRNAWLQAGLPVETPATTVDRQCGSAQQAVNFAAALIASGVHDIAIGSGVEHMGHIPMGVGFKWVDDVGSPWPQELLERYNLVPQGISAEMIADKWEIPRSELDEIGVRSHQRAHQATEEGRFEREIVPFQVNGDTYVTDQGIRPDTNLEALSQLKTVFKEDGKITAGNSSQISDGAAAVLLMAREKADALGLKPRARIVDQTTVGVDPVMMLTGPIPATHKLLGRNGMKIGDIDLFEVNEAFASVLAAWRRELEPDMDRVNVNGGAIALGHPLGSTGARLITTLLHELERSDKETGLVTMCCGGGLGTGTLIQRL